MGDGSQDLSNHYEPLIRLAGSDGSGERNHFGNQDEKHDEDSHEVSPDV
jgi:hypothetical protein